MKNGIAEVNNRTGMETKSLPGITIQVDLEKEFPLLTTRKIRVENFVAEMMWFVSGETNTNKFLRDKTKIWDSFTDGVGVLKNSYGHRWQKAFGRDQLSELIELLEKDPSSRQAVVVTWDPGSDGLMGPKRKNVPCPFTFTVNIIGGRLHLHNIIRSNDMILGCPTDAAGFAFLALMLAQKLGVRPGIYTHSISNAHIYSNHYDAAKEMIRRGGIFKRHTTYQRPFLPGYIPYWIETIMFDEAIKLTEGTFKGIVKDFKENYNPKPAIKGLLISL